MTLHITVHHCTNGPSVLPALTIYVICHNMHARVLCVARQLCSSLLMPAVEHTSVQDCNNMTGSRGLKCTVSADMSARRSILSVA